MTTAKILLDLFIVFTRVALFSWGGGPASMALMQRESTAAGWVTPDEFADALAIGNALPGPIATKTSAYIGYKVAGFPGAIIATSGTVIPATALMLVIAYFFFGIKDSPNVKAMLMAVRPVVVGMLVWTAYDMSISVFGAHKIGWASALAHGWDKILIVIASFGLLAFTKINPVIVIIGAALLGFLVYR